MSNNKTYKDVWKKVDDLSGGGQGETIRATNIENEEIQCVIKILKSQKDWERRARMHRETVALNTLSHPNLPKVIDSNTEYWEDLDYRLFFATEFIPGSTLSDIAFTDYGLDEKINLTIKIAEVINYCHQRGIIHRDIKPDNIILKNNSFDEPIIIDFGISFNFNDDDNDDLTPTGQHLGNRFLILPEQKVGEVSKRDPRSDITCLVGLFYYFLTQKMPTILLDEHSKKPHQRADSKELIDQFPQHQKYLLNNIFDIGFNPLIDHRWQTAQSFINELKMISEAQPLNEENQKELLEFIKKMTVQKDFNVAKMLLELARRIDKVSESVLTTLVKELGDGWTMYTSNFIDGKSVLNKKIYPENYIRLELKTNTKIYAFVTGNEFVIQVYEENKNEKYEAFRHPIIEDINWEPYKENLRKYYITELAKIM